MRRSGVYIGTFELSGEMLPLRTSDLKSAAVVVLELEALRRSVVGFGLALGTAKCSFLQLIGQKQAALKRESRQVQRSLAFAEFSHVLISGGRPLQ